MAIIGIDLGTTNSLACIYRDGKAELIPNELGNCKTSSAVSVLEDGTVLVGAAAKERLVSHPESTAASFKIWMGTEKVLTLGDRQFKPEELSALVLRQLLEDTKQYLDEPVEEAVISVPAYFNDDQRCATKLAAQLAGLTVKRLINEPSAAALYHRYSTQSGDCQLVIVDFGGGTLDVSIVDCFENIIEIVAIAGDNRLGGDDIDRAVVAHFCKENGLSEDRLEPSLRASLYQQAEMAKIALSGAPAASISLQQGEEQYSLVLTNDLLRQLCGPVFQKVRAVIGRAMKDRERSGRINDVILVGGSSQLTVFGDFLEELFGRRPRVAGGPDEMDYAEGRGDIPQETEEPPVESDARGSKNEGWTFSDKPVVWDEGPNPYADHEAIRSFLELYTGKQRNQSFHINSEQVYRPCLPWERVAALTDTDKFFFLLPITTTAYDQYETVKAEILRRLTDTAAPETDRAFIAGCLADQVCGLPVPGKARIAPEFDEDGEPVKVRSLPPESVLPFEVFAEDADRLLVCVWFQQEEVLALYQQTPYGKQAVRDGRFDEVSDAQSAVALARQLMQEQLFPTGFPMEELKVLPDAVHAQWDYMVISHEIREKKIELSPGWSTPVKLLGEDVTPEKLEELLTQFDAGRVQRLEWSWRDSIPVGEEQGYEPRRSLVFLKDKAGYACLYFDDFRAQSYALLEQPEIYGKDKKAPKQVPFRKSKLFDDVVHQRFSSIRRHLRVIFRQASWPGNVQFMAQGIWDHAEIVSHGRVKYDLDKQLLGDFPMEWAYNRMDMPFYFSLYPDLAALVDDTGNVEALAVSDLERPRLQQMLARFLQGGFSKLRLTWGKRSGKRAHIVLLRDSGRFLMAWILEEKRTVEYHVADRWTYMDVEGKKYPKDTFRGRAIPAYLIHNGVTPLRNALELLLARIDRPSIITGEMGEYAGERPVKPRPYETLWMELVGDTLDSE